MEDDLLQLEEKLRAFTPGEMSDTVLTRMVAAMESWHEGPMALDTAVEDGKVVAISTHQKRESASWSPTWAAAAAVALIGALGALLVPNPSDQNVTVMGNLGPVPLLRQASFMPVSGERIVNSMTTSMTSDRQGTPYQVIQVISLHEASFEGEKNVGLKISRPEVETFIVPVSY